MAVPTPPLDNSGGYIVIKVQGGGQTHRMRFHVEPFTNDNLGTYNVTTGGREANVQATAGNIMKALAWAWPATWTLSLDAVFWKNAGVISQLFTVTAPAAQAGTGTGSVGLTEEFFCCNYRTQGGSRARYFMFAIIGWAYQDSTTFAASNANTITIMVSYFTGGTPTGFTTTTRVVGHDGTLLVAPAHVTYGVNKKLRRKAGGA